MTIQTSSHVDLNQIGVEVSKKDIQFVKIWLATMKADYPKIMTRALNKSLTGARFDFVTITREFANLKSKFIRDTAKLNKANWSKLSASLVAKSDSVPLLHYGAKQKGKGVSVNVLIDHPRTLIRHAFIATMKSGHKGVFWRKDVRWRGLPSAISKKTRPEFARLPKTKEAQKYRLPIEELWGPSIEALWEERPTKMNELSDKAGDRLQKNFLHELDFAISKLPKN